MNKIYFSRSTFFAMEVFAIESFATLGLYLTVKTQFVSVQLLNKGLHLRKLISVVDLLMFSIDKLFTKIHCVLEKSNYYTENKLSLTFFRLKNM